MRSNNILKRTAIIPYVEMIDGIFKQAEPTLEIVVTHEIVVPILNNIGI